MSVIVTNAKNGHEIAYIEEEYGKAYSESCHGIERWKTLSKTPMKTRETQSSE